MGQRRKTAKERESQGVRSGVGGLVLVVFGVATQSPLVGALGVVMVVIGTVMWAAGMARSD